MTLKDKGELVVPASIQRRAGIKSGDAVVFKVSGGIIQIIPKQAAVEDGYSPSKRKEIDARLAKAARGPHHGPFHTADKAITFLNQEISKRKVIPHPK